MVVDHSMLRRLSLRRPETRRELADWISVFLGMRMPEHGLCGHHQTPLDYLEHSFFEGGDSSDAVVWACRGGGKTMVGAVATLLDLLFKPGVQVRILGGSFEQSEKMYEYLRELVRRHFSHLLAAAPTQRRLELKNGSRVDVLAQSDRAVRGQRVQKLRCDEVELFDPEVWRAAQLTTRSLAGGPAMRGVRGAIEVFSTMHRPGGLMQGILAEGNECGMRNAKCGIGEAATPGRKVFAWCVWDVIERCPPERACAGCPLWEECRGRAKGAAGFVKIDDVIAMRGRVSKATWEHEMLCLPPRFEDAVFPAFRREVHVRKADLAAWKREGGAMVEGLGPARMEAVICGVDFGFAQAFVCLWIVMLRGLGGVGAAGGGAPRVAWVIDEMVAGEQTVDRNVAAMRERSAGHPPAVVYCDVAGRQINSQTGKADERLLRDAGFAVKCRGMGIGEGIALIGDLLEPAAGAVRLLIDPKCVRLIEAMEGYRMGADGAPVKDGRQDHLIDALRYALVNHDRPAGKVVVRAY